jgi:hypothetical protein
MKRVDLAEQMKLNGGEIIGNNLMRVFQEVLLICTDENWTLI